MREWNKKNPGKSSEYKKRNPAKVNAGKRKWEQENPERHRAARQRHYQRHKDRVRASNLKHHHGLTLEQYDEMVKRQGGLCALCREPEIRCRKNGAIYRLHVDHDHNCCEGKGCGKCVRALLCSRCNIGLGLFRDRADLLAKAIEYLSAFGGGGAP